MVKHIKKNRVKTWEELKAVSRTVIIDGKETLIVPEATCGLANTSVVLDWQHEYEREWIIKVLQEEASQGQVVPLEHLRDKEVIDEWN